MAVLQRILSPMLSISCERNLSLSELREAITSLCEIVSVIGIDKSKLLAAIGDESFTDIEDRLQSECVSDFGADYIVTRNIKDFTHSSVPAILPEDLLNMLDN